MSLPQSEANMVGTHILPVADLGLAVTVTSAANVDSTVFTTGYPATLVVLSKLTSGSGTLKMDIADTAANISYGSPLVTLAVSGTALQAASFDTTASELFVGIQQSSGSTAVWNQLAVMALYELTAGEEWYCIRNGANSVGNQSLGDGSGVADLSIA